MKYFKILIIISAITLLLITVFGSCKSTNEGCPDCPGPVTRIDTIEIIKIDTIQVVKIDTIIEIDSIQIIKIDTLFISDTVPIIKIDSVPYYIIDTVIVLEFDTIYQEKIIYHIDTITVYQEPDTIFQIDSVYLPSGNIEYKNNLYIDVSIDSARNIDDPLLKEFFRKFDSANHRL